MKFSSILLLASSALAMNTRGNKDQRDLITKEEVLKQLITSMTSSKYYFIYAFLYITETKSTCKTNMFLKQNSGMCQINATLL